MDDLKIITNSTQSMSKAHEIITNYTKLIGMKLNPLKCEISTSGPKIPKNMSNIPIITKNNTYKYLWNSMRKE